MSAEKHWEYTDTFQCSKKNHSIVKFTSNITLREKDPLTEKPLLNPPYPFSLCKSLWKSSPFPLLRSISTADLGKHRRLK